MQKQNYSPATIRLNRACLKMLMRNGANLLDPESTKAALARYNASENRKRNVINASTQFLKLSGMTWEKPKCVEVSLHSLGKRTRLLSQWFRTKNVCFPLTVQGPNPNHFSVVCQAVR
jgi:hypothetical protein